MNPKTRIALIITIIVLLIDLLLYIFQPLGENLYFITDWTVVVFALAAVITGYYALRLHGTETLHGKALLFLVLGSLFWAFGELFWALLETILKVEPFPSIADVFWYIGYPLFGIGLYYIWKITRASAAKQRIFIGALAILATLIIVSFYGIFPHLADPGLTKLERAIVLGYVILDFAVIVGEIIIIVSLLGRELIKPWAIILIAGFFTVFADIMFAQIASLYESGSFFGVLWDAGYILMAFGFFYYRQTISGMLKPNGQKKTR